MQQQEQRPLCPLFISASLNFSMDLGREPPWNLVSSSIKNDWRIASLEKEKIDMKT
jgi:hypothetical protein